MRSFIIWTKQLLRLQLRQYQYLRRGGDGDVAVAEIVLDEEAVGKLKVSEIRDALRKQGLSMTGLKAVLQTRLLEAVANNVPVVGDRPGEEVENQACDNFQPGAY